MKTFRILLVENIHPAAVARLTQQGFEVESLNHSPNEAELNTLLPKFDVLGIRSKTELSSELLLKNKHLYAIGAFCIGTNQINLKAAQELGLPVFNAPHANTRSVAELVLAEMICLSRQIFDRSWKAHKGEWQKSAEGSHEVRGKTLGIVGYGHIGSQLSILAESLGMNVIFYDAIKKLPLGNAKALQSLSAVLSQSDFVTFHVPETAETKNMIGNKELALMKKGSFLINASRGTVIVLDDLAEALKKNHLAGAAIDVFPIEPNSNKDRFISPIQGFPNVILTPHVGGSTEEAQYSIGLEVAESFCKFLQIGSTSGAVNFPNVTLSPGKNVKRILNIHRNEPGVLGEINGIISKSGANIQAQYLATDEKVGYMVMDLETDQVDPILQQINALKRTLRTRWLY